MAFHFFKRKPAANNSKLAAYNNSRKGNKQYFCYIPFTQLYISFGGNIFACCGNRRYLLGKYPEQNLHDIWFGEPIQKLRNFLAKGDMSLGCDVCLEQVNNGNFDLVLARQYDQYAPFMGKYPVSFEFELSNTCNLDCIMCYDEFSTSVAKRHNPSYQQPFSPYDDEFIRQFEEFIPHLKEISFKGGEPFLIKVYMDIWQRIIDLNPSVMVRIITNTTAFNDRIMQMLLKSNFYLNVSVDSLIPERYEKIRRNASYDKTMANISQMLELNRQKGLAHMTLMVCLMTINWDEMPAFIRFCNKNDVAIMFLYITFPAVYLSIKNTGPKTQSHIYKTLSAADVEDNTSYSKHNSSVYRQLLTQLGTWLEQTEKQSMAEHLSALKDCVRYYLNNEVLFTLNLQEREAKSREYLDLLDGIIQKHDAGFHEKLIEMDKEELAKMLVNYSTDVKFYFLIDENYRELQQKISG